MSLEHTATARMGASLQREQAALPERCDIAVVGGGIVGLASALTLLDRHRELRLVILEKEQSLATHQTAHNSGVIHSGVYFRPGSQKARLCVEGARLMRVFCAQHGIRVAQLGKVIVATEPAKVPCLMTLYEHGIANGARGLELVGPQRLREIEPNAAGLLAVYSPQTASVDFSEVALAMANLLRNRGAVIATGARLVAIHGVREGLRLTTLRGDILARILVNCAGLHADVVARMAGDVPSARVIPFRSEHFVLRTRSRDLVKGIIYPAPPFLGVHLTRTVNGEVIAGRNAVPAFAREGYRFSTIRPGDLAAMLGYRGFWMMGAHNRPSGRTVVWRTLSRGAFVQTLRRLVPEIRAVDVVRAGSGVQPQVVAPDGTLLDEFHIMESPRAVHVLNAHSPAATASLALGQRIAGLVFPRLSQ